MRSVSGQWTLQASLTPQVADTDKKKKKKKRRKEKEKRPIQSTGRISEHLIIHFRCQITPTIMRTKRAGDEGRELSGHDEFTEKSAEPSLAYSLWRVYCPATAGMPP